MYSVDQEMKYFKTHPNLLKEGSSHSFKEDRGSLVLDEMRQRGYYFLRCIDSEEREMSWNRVKLKDDIEGNAACSVYVYVSDWYDSEFESLLQDHKVSPEEKLELLISVGATKYEEHKDILLHKFCGRYLWLAITCYQLEGLYTFKGLEIEYPMQTFVDYLPEVYVEGGDFLRHYIGIFQSLYLDVEHVIDHIPDYLDVQTMPEAFLNEIGSWLGIDNRADIFSPKQMRQILSEAIALNGGKGTKVTLERVLTLYTGIKPKIIEYFNWSEQIEGKSLCQTYQWLYGKDPSYFAVIIEKEKCTEVIDREKLQLLIDQFKPAMTRYQLILLEKNQCSDWHCYLGVNSYLADFMQAKLDISTLSGSRAVELR